MNMGTLLNLWWNLLTFNQCERIESCDCMFYDRHASFLHICCRHKKRQFIAGKFFPCGKTANLPLELSFVCCAVVRIPANLLPCWWIRPHRHFAQCALDPKSSPQTEPWSVQPLSHGTGTLCYVIINRNSLHHMHWMQPANRRIIGQSLNCNEWCCTDCSGVRSTVDAGADCIKSSNQATSWVLQLMAVCQFNSITHGTLGHLWIL